MPQVSLFLLVSGVVQATPDKLQSSIRLWHIISLLIKQVKKYKKQLDNCKMHEYNKKCAVRRKQNIGLK